MTKVQKNIILWFSYAIVAVVFLMHAIFCFYPTSFGEPSEAAWSIPSYRPSGMRSGYAKNPQEFLYALKNDSSVELMDNIDLSGNTLTPFTRSSSFTLEGNGYSILGLRITSGKNAGLIGSNTSSVTIRNVNLEVDISITSSSQCYIGGFIGYAKGSVSISNSTVSGEFYIGSSTNHYVGGFVGYNDSTSTLNLSNCINYADIDGRGAIQAGGLIGHSGNSTSLSVCANFGDIEGGTSFIGGLVGYYSGTKTISKCFNSGNVSGTTGRLGGIAGYTYSKCTLSSCYNTGDITGGATEYVGGLIGQANSSISGSYCYSSGDLDSSYAGDSKEITDSTTYEIASYKRIFTELYSANTCSIESSQFPEAEPFNNQLDTKSSRKDYSDTYAKGTLVVRSINKRGKIIPNLVGNNNGTFSNSYFYSSLSDTFSGELCTVTVSIKLNGRYTDLTEFVVNTNKRITVKTSKRVIPQRMKDITNSDNFFPDEYEFEIDGVSIFSVIPTYYFNDYISDLRFPLSASGNCTVSVKTLNNSSFLVSFPYYGNTFITPSYFWIYGVKPTISGNYILIKPMLGFDMSTATINNKYDSNYISTEDKHQSVRVPLPSASTGNYVGTKVSSRTSIKSKNMGSNYTTNSGINDGYPILEDFYWAYY